MEREREREMKKTLHSNICDDANANPIQFGSQKTSDKDGQRKMINNIDTYTIKSENVDNMNKGATAGETINVKDENKKEASSSSTNYLEPFILPDDDGNISDNQSVNYNCEFGKNFYFLFAMLNFTQFITLLL